MNKLIAFLVVSLATSAAQAEMLVVDNERCMNYASDVWYVAEQHGQDSDAAWEDAYARCVEADEYAQSVANVLRAALAESESH